MTKRVVKDAIENTVTCNLSYYRRSTEDLIDDDDDVCACVNVCVK